MSSPAKKRNKSKQNKKRNSRNMQQRKRAQHGSKNSNNKSKQKRKRSNELQTNLSWGVAVILLCLIAFVFIYSQRNKQTIVSIKPEQPNDESQPINLNRKPLPQSLRLKYDHSLAHNNKHLLLSKQQNKQAPIPFLFKAKVSRMWRHDKNDFTQGLELVDVNNDGQLIMLESTGLYKQSKLKYIELQSDTNNNNNKNNNKNILPTVQRSHALKGDYFGEGCTIYFDEATQNKYIYQLTWKKRKVIVYDLELNEIKEMELPKQMKEGWGIYYDFDGAEFIATDGSSDIFFIEPISFTMKRKITVQYKNADREPKESKIISLRNLNEIEMVNGWILANVWYNTNIYIISPYNGFVYGIIECWAIFPKEIKRTNHAVLNGIAFDSVNNQLIITGKNWPNIFAIQVPQFMMDMDTDTANGQK